MSCLALNPFPKASRKSENDPDTTRKVSHRGITPGYTRMGRGGSCCSATNLPARNRNILGVMSGGQGNHRQVENVQGPSLHFFSRSQKEVPVGAFTSGGTCMVQRIRPRQGRTAPQGHG